MARKKELEVNIELTVNGVRHIIPPDEVLHRIRRVLMLQFRHSMSCRQTARMLGCSVRALTTRRKELKYHGNVSVTD